MTFPLLAGLRRAFANVQISTTEPPEAHTARPAPTSAQSGQLSELPTRPRAESEPLAATAIAALERGWKETLRMRNRVNAILDRLIHNQGIPEYCESDPVGNHRCYRFADKVLVVQPQAYFREGPGVSREFQVHLHGEGLLAFYQGQWIENPGDDFMAGLEAATRGSQTAFRL